jgi:hypothetical protein
MREIVTASSAAGVAVAFGSPIGGVLFSIEASYSLPYKKTADNRFDPLGDEPDLFDPYHVAKLCVRFGRDFHSGCMILLA